MTDNTVMRPRQRLGRELRDRRVLAGLSGPALASMIGITQSKVSRTETAKFRPDMPVIKKWLRATKTSVFDTDRILALAQEAATEIPEYRTIFRGSLLSAKREAQPSDSAALLIRHFSLLQIPEPFQTRRYAQLGIAAADRLDAESLAASSALTAAVDARLDRGRRLVESGSPAYHAVLMEAALHHRPAGATGDEAAEARELLLEFAAMPTVTIQVIASGTPLPYAPTCAFVFTQFQDASEEPMVSVRVPALEMTFSGSDDLVAFERSWSDLAAAALDPSESAQLIRSIAWSDRPQVTTVD